MSLPPTSPRLPSPPPPAEIQIGPKSPLMGPDAARQAAQIEQSAIDTNAKRRIHPGTKSADMAAGPPLVPLHELDSAFQLQEHLAALHYYHTASHTTPINRDTAKLLATPPPGIDRTLWLYELCRFLIAQCNSLIVGFLFDTPPCSAATCPEMRAGEWQFLCAVHDTPKSCCAIDYCCHTLDWAANVVTNPKIFPSRFVVDAHDKNTAQKNLVNVFRRLHRIFAHAWFQHRGVFWSLESQSGVYVFFKTVCDVYDLLPAENYKLPPEAEGLDNTSGAGDLGTRGTDRRQQPQQQHPGPILIAKPPGQREAEDGDYSAMSRTNTRRHIKSSPSTGSAIMPVPEADEDESGDLSSKLRDMRISVPLTAAREEAPELTSIPVVVDHRPIAAGEQPLRPSSVIPPPGTTADESQSKPALEPEAADFEPEAPAPEHPSGPEPEPQPEPEVPATVDAAQSSAPDETTKPQPEEESTPAAEEAAPETKESENTGPETKEVPPPTSSVDSSSGEKDSATAAATDGHTETETGAKTADTAEKVEDPTQNPIAEAAGPKSSGSESETATGPESGPEEAEPNAGVQGTEEEEVVSSAETKSGTDQEKETSEEKQEGEAQ
ncbi:Mob1/phocein [Parathielavia appendiculata]|uniref:Mob1/phocein n=1 Tax=Parathielavia appendiculata TaxID=2587402 RepID=A0AAN6Z595_9PEZI|nr:Mob1/phocein [Parathielavia appendiculata]